MPSRRGVPVDPALCRRCQINAPAITIRTEPLCPECFMNYVQTKLVKRMESFRVRNTSSEFVRRMLVPVLAVDASTIALIHLLDRHLRRQIEKSGRTGFKLVVVRVVDGADGESRPEGDSKNGREKQTTGFARLRECYPLHEYHDTVHLASILNDPDLRNLLHLPLVDSSSTSPSSLQHDLHTLFTTTFKSSTSRADAHTLLSRRLLSRYARTHHCEAIFLSDTTTRLAARTLAETAKGRGFALPLFVADGAATSFSSSDDEGSSGGEQKDVVPSYYPLRDLLESEIGAYVTFVALPTSTASVPSAASTANPSSTASQQTSQEESDAADSSPAHSSSETLEQRPQESEASPRLSSLLPPSQDTSAAPTLNLKATTIDALMTTYCAGLEREFPSIVTNVVKTTGKLQLLPSQFRGEEVEMKQRLERCEFCEMPMRVESSSTTSEGVENGKEGEVTAPERSRLCWGCIRTLSR